MNDTKKAKIPEEKTVKLSLLYKVFFVKCAHWGEIIIQTREHNHNRDTSSSFFFTCGETKKPKWAKELLRRNDIYHIYVGHDTIVISVVAATNKYSLMDVWNKIKECLEKEVLNRISMRM